VAELWVGGDPASLRTVSDSLEPCESQAKAVVGVIDDDVRKIAQDESWTGDAATAFATHWEIASVAASAVGTFCAAAAQILTKLAGQLDSTDAALRQVAADARAQGVAIGSDGRPVAGPVSADVYQLATEYASVWRLAQEEADGFRVEANRALQDLLNEIMKVVDGAGEGPELAGADKVALADYLRGVGAIPAATRAHVDDLVGNARSAYQNERAAWLKERDAARAEQRAMSLDVKLARSGALRDLNGLQSELDALGRQSHPIAGMLNVSVGDVADGVRALSGASKAAEGSKTLSFLDDLPVIDVAAAGLGTYFQATDDISKGESAPRAITQDLAANATGLVAGAAVGGAVAGAITGAPVVAVAAGAAVGGAVAIGVGDLVYEGFHEHWDEDIQKDGVVGGLLAGTGHTFSNTGRDLGNLAKGAGGAAKSVWHSVFG
jgi:uncharacterized protein YukE